MIVKGELVVLPSVAGQQLVAGQLLTEHQKRDVERRWRQFAVFDSIGDHLNGEPFGITDSFLARLPVSHDAGQFQRLRDPATVIFPIELNRKVHSLIVRQAGFYTWRLILPMAAKSP